MCVQSEASGRVGTVRMPMLFKHIQLTAKSKGREYLILYTLYLFIADIWDYQI